MSRGAKKRAREDALALDTGPSERAKHNRMAPQLISQRSGRATHMRVVDQNEPDRLLLNGTITLLEYNVCEAFWKDIYSAGLNQLRAQNYGRVMGSGGTPDITSKEAFNRMKVQRAMRAIERSADKSTARVVLNVCMGNLSVTNKPLAEKLHKGLAALASFYEGWR